MSTEDKSTNRKWIGLAHVYPLPGNTALGGSNRAYVGVVGLASNADIFVRLVIEKCHEYDFEVIEVEDIEVFKDRCAKFNVDPSTKDIVESLDDENPFSFLTFHAYKG